jgi:hypothetical protein
MISCADPEFYPDFKSELKLVIEELLPNQSAGFKSRAKKILQNL